MTEFFACWLQSSVSISETEDVLFIFRGAVFNVSCKDRHELVSLLTEKIAETGPQEFQRTVQGSYTVLFWRKSEPFLSVFSDVWADDYIYWRETELEVMLSTRLTDFDSDFNCEWVDGYFHGRDATSPDTALKGVYRLEGGDILNIDRDLKVSIQRNIDLVSRFRKSFRQADRIDATSLRQKIDGRVVETIKNLADQYGKLGLMMSQGVDSLYILALLKKSGVEFETFTRFYPDYKKTNLWKIHQQAMAACPHRNHINTVGSEVQFEPAYYHQPDNHLWHSMAITRSKTVQPAIDRGVKCLLWANMGDYLFLHRQRYLLAYFLCENRGNPVVMELVDLVRRDPDGFNAKEEFMAIKKSFMEQILSEHHDFEASYCFNPKEFNRNFFRDLILRDNLDFICFVFNHVHSSKGVSHERDLRVSSGIMIADPMKDSSLFDEFLCIDHGEMQGSFKNASLQAETIREILGEVPVPGKNTNFTPSEKEFSLNESDWRNLAEGISLLFELNVYTRDYYQRLFDRALEKKMVDGQLIRVLTFWYFCQNRIVKQKPDHGKIYWQKNYESEPETTGYA